MVWKTQERYHVRTWFIHKWSSRWVWQNHHGYLMFCLTNIHSQLTFLHSHKCKPILPLGIQVTLRPRGTGGPGGPSPERTNRNTIQPLSNWLRDYILTKLNQWASDSGSSLLLWGQKSSVYLEVAPLGELKVWRFRRACCYHLRRPCLEMEPRKKKAEPRDTLDNMI